MHRFLARYGVAGERLLISGTGCLRHRGRAQSLTSCRRAVAHTDRRTWISRARTPGICWPSTRSRDSLLKHAMAVEAGVRGYARRFGEDEEAWGFVGLHPRLRLRALAGRARTTRTAGWRFSPGSGVPGVRDAGHPVARRLHRRDAGDAGWSTRCSPATRWPGSSPPPRWCGRAKSVLDLEASSVMKRMKDKAFARAVSRDDLRAGGRGAGLPLEEHIANVIESMRETRRCAGPARQRCRARAVPACPRVRD